MKPPPNNFETAIIVLMRLGGVGLICFSKVKCEPSRLISSLSAIIPIIVSMQAANDEAQRSVGEKELPSPLLSTGAAVVISAPDGP